MGVGEVTSKAISVGNFSVEHKGEIKPLIDLELKAPEIKKDMNDPELAEYMLA